MKDCRLQIADCKLGSLRRERVRVLSCGLSEEQRVFLRKLLILGFMGLFLFSFTQAAKPQEAKKEIVIKVKDEIIAMPGNKVSRVPIRAARVRSDGLRNLNAKYYAKYIEHLYKLKEKKDVVATSGDPNLKGYRDVVDKPTASSGRDDSGPLDLSRVFSRQLKMQLEEEGKQVEEVKNAFIIVFMPEEPLSIDDILSSYRDLEVVVYAEEIRRAE